MKFNPVEIPMLAATELKEACAGGYLVLTRSGKPVAYVLPTTHYDEEDIGYMTDPEFWKMIQERRQEKGGIPLEEIEAEIAERERSEARKAGARKPKSGRKKAG